jgi:fibronectin type 3 domain-containing protein
MKIQTCVFSALAMLWLGSAEIGNAAVKLHTLPEETLRGVFISPEWGSVSTGDGASMKTVARAFDGSPQTSWLVNMEAGKTCWVDFRFNDDVCWVLAEYSIISGTVSPDRDPQGWELQGSRDGVTWTTLDSKEQQSFVARRWAKTYRMQLSEGYNRYRLNFRAKSEQVMEISEVEFTVKPMVLPPGGLTAETERGGVALNWQSVDGATGYTVRRAIRREGPYLLVASGISDTRYLDKGPFTEADFSFYTVSAELSTAQGVLSSPMSVVTPVNAPADLRLKQGNDSVALEWTPAPRAVAYVVKRSLLREGPYAVIGTLITAPAYIDKGLSAGTAYYYVVCGVANGKEGCETAPVGASFRPSAPTGLVATPDEKSITLNWNAVALAGSYKVMRLGSDEAQTKAEIATIVDGTTFVDKTASPRRSYVYTLVAVNDCGESVESEAVSASLLRPPSWWRR